MCCCIPIFSMLYPRSWSQTEGAAYSYEQEATRNEISTTIEPIDSL